MDSIEITGISVEEAVKEALEQLGLREDEVAIEVLATPRAGVLGLGARNARVRVTRKSAQAGSNPQPAPAPQARKEGASDGNRRERENQRRGRNDSGARRENPVASDDEGGVAGRKSVGVEEQRREATVILQQILEQMGERTDVRQIEVDAETVELEIKGDGSGILIGRHGQTLDALEYIVNRILARRIKDAAPISLETESYRARRRQQLHRMALSMGEKAKREHKPVRLEPMVPRDRRVVHLALKDDPMLTTRSAGDGQLRSIEIVPADSAARREPRGEAQPRGRRREPDRDPQRERETQRIEPERGNEALGEQGGFKHGQKRIV
ncbi:MAG TPA: RNA-binding cell elongation regulator Jag/EloR [Candidatus Binatus sp.]|uniref:RNA-binding cell elongation regulator Jag/EloR n=1 Tax=Candidatus Binatus sp. TaxID=2811406 RepID=UPI002B48D761|nr:RNA-binding cell elongation regulator Jag/EloR [Candidatus Binatus sp.]HKN14750.1 RNA-binding cell elongation regulator Jag/EloR [Candidatus Binatus sp.]